MSWLSPLTRGSNITWNLYRTIIMKILSRRRPTVSCGIFGTRRSQRQMAFRQNLGFRIRKRSPRYTMRRATSREPAGIADACQESG